MLYSFTSRRRKYFFATALLSLTVLCFALDSVNPTENARATFFDVGQGDSLLLQTPERQAILIDGGLAPLSSIDGSTPLMRALRAQKISRLKLMVVTHPDADHIGGLLPLIGALPIEMIWLCWNEDDNPWVTRLRKRAAAHRVIIRSPHSTDIDGVSIEPLWPPIEDGKCQLPFRATNDRSIVLRVRYGESDFLATGDISKLVEDELVSRHANGLHTLLLKVPHHGSRTSSTNSFLSAVHPAVAVISAGTQNLYRHPHSSIVMRYQHRGVTLLRTDRMGAISVDLSHDGTLRWSAPWSIYP
jgi:competence protein ComEC